MLPRPGGVAWRHRGIGARRQRIIGAPLAAPLHQLISLGGGSLKHLGLSAHGWHQLAAQRGVSLAASRRIMASLNGGRSASAQLIGSASSRQPLAQRQRKRGSLFIISVAALSAAAASFGGQRSAAAKMSSASS